MISIVTSIIFAVTAAQQSVKDPIRDFCRRHQHQSCIVDNQLYVDGGLVYYGTGVTPDKPPETNTWLLTWDVNNISSGSPAPKIPSDKGPQVASVAGGVLWPDQTNKLFYLFGGEHNNETLLPSDTLWLYDTIYNTWNRSANPDPTQLSLRWPSFGAGAVSEDGEAFYYGGYLNKKATLGWKSDSDFMLNGLLSLDMNTRVWKNMTYDVVPRAEGSLHYIPAGSRGLLIYFGGVEMINGTRSYANMSGIHVFDIASSKWYTQNTTGDLPQSRRGFCAGVTWATDQSSYNIYMYGGINANETALGDIYVLSLPSFQWIGLWPNPLTQPVPGGKAWASCEVINRTYMGIISGYYTNTSRTACDRPMIGGFASLSLGVDLDQGDDENVWELGSGLTNMTQYLVPSNITNRIGVNGGATARAPMTGWMNNELAMPFKKKYSAVARKPTRAVSGMATASTSPPPTTSSQSPSTSHLSTGAKAGIAIGAIVAVIAFAGAVAFYCLRRRAKNSNSDSANTAGNISEMQDQDAILAKRKWFLAGRWRSEVDARSKPQELDSKNVRVIAGPPVELDASVSR